MYQEYNKVSEVLVVQYKLRTIVRSKSKYPYEIKGITIPKEIADFFEQTWFHITKSGTSIVLESGARIEPTPEHLNELDWEVFKI